ncbi:hypothetical protein [Nocardia sp. R6R-6]|uniref:hypothetical protein n=1 Tax=Nocardia sp. R6R-6 TaxID=3459303 RepID=UPI00403E0561
MTSLHIPSRQVVEYQADSGYDAIQVRGGTVAWPQARRPLVAEGDHEAKIY